MEKSVFADKTILPTEENVKAVLGESYLLWTAIKTYVLQKYPQAKEAWHFPGSKHGWNFRMKDKKRNILYFIPLVGYFQVAFVFGEKATEFVLKSNVSEDIKRELAAAKVYVEGRGIRIPIRTQKVLKDVKFLIDTKLTF